MTTTLFSVDFINGGFSSRISRFKEASVPVNYSTCGLLPNYNTNTNASARILLLKGTVPSLPSSQLPSWSTDISPNILVDWKVGVDINFALVGNEVPTLGVGSSYVQASQNGTATWIAFVVQQGNSTSNILQIIYGTVGAIGSGADIVMGDTTVSVANYYSLQNIPFDLSWFPVPWFNTDPYQSYSVLNLPMRGANGSTTFTDTSPSGKAITRFGNTQITTSEWKFSSQPSSGYFDGNGDYLTTPNSTDFDFGTGDFTIEAWVNFISYRSGSAIVYKGTTNYGPFLIYMGGSNELAFYASGNGASWNICNDLRIATSPSLGGWHHIAVSRYGNTFRTFFNGIFQNSVTSSTALLNNTGTLNMGLYLNTTTTFNGYINDLRITKGVARYQYTFPTPTQPFA